MAEAERTRAGLKTPKAAAIAGIVSSVLMFFTFICLRIVIPADIDEPGLWLRTHPRLVAAAFSLVPLTGVAFLWFIGVLRDRLGEKEDRFFATIFLGSGLLFLAILFVIASIAGGIISSYAAAPEPVLNDSATFHFARAVVYDRFNIYAIKTGAVFMTSASTLVIYTGMASRWMAILGYALAVTVLVGSAFFSWSFAVFPLWVLVLSVQILVEDIRSPDRGLGLLAEPPKISDEKTGFLYEDRPGGQ